MSKVAAIQMCSTADVNKNLATAKHLIEQAVQAQAELVVLPEAFAFMEQTDSDKLAVAEAYGEGPIQAFLTNTAKEHKLWIIAGTVPVQSEVENKIRSASLVFDPTGLCVARYDKIHLFDVIVGKDAHYCESEHVDAGTGTVVVTTPLGHIGLSVCYDVRFPELYRQLINQNAEIITIPAAFTAVTGAVHWQTLVRSRAIENLVYVIAAAQTGTHASGRESYGHSMIVDPWGEIIAEAGTEEGIITAEINLEHMHKVRERFPCLQHIL